MTGYLFPLPLLWLLSLFAQGQSGLVLHTDAVSPSVEATMLFRPGPASSAAELQLLVLWRGEAGWMIKDIGVPNWIGTGGGRTPGEPVTTELHLGVVNMTLSFEPATHQLSIDGQDVPLRSGDNVVLVGTVGPGVVGGQLSPNILGTLHVDPHSDASPKAQEYIRRSPELIQFLQCDASLADKPPAVQLMKRLCSDYGF
jgi:hypothetical protein